MPYLFFDVILLFGVSKDPAVAIYSDSYIWLAQDMAGKIFKKKIDNILAEFSDIEQGFGLVQIPATV